MKCLLCGYEFKEEEGNPSCQGCPLSGSCRMIKCPNCNYEVPEEPKLIKAFKSWRERKNGNK